MTSGKKEYTLSDSTSMKLKNIREIGKITRGVRVRRAIPLGSSCWKGPNSSARDAGFLVWVLVPWVCSVCENLSNTALRL